MKKRSGRGWRGIVSTSSLSSSAAGRAVGEHNSTSSQSLGTTCSPFALEQVEEATEPPE